MGKTGRRTGILFNNELDDFDIPHTHRRPASRSPNYPEPGKRPLSSMSPAIVLDHLGKVKLVIGASGGTKIISATADVSVIIINLSLLTHGLSYFIFIYLFTDTYKAHSP